MAPRRRATRAVLPALCIGPSAEPWVASGLGQLRRLVDRAIWSVAADVAPLSPAATWPQSLCAIGDQIFLCTEAAVLRYRVSGRS